MILQIICLEIVNLQKLFERILEAYINRPKDNSISLPVENNRNRAKGRCNLFARNCKDRYIFKEARCL
jgi:hypothetical protein